MPNNTFNYSSTEQPATCLMPNETSTTESVLYTAGTMRDCPASTKNIGAVVLGGDYQGLGIVRSLGHHGVPVCVIDDEYSIARYSRYVQHSVSVPSLRREEEIVDALLRTNRRLGLDGWVVFPTRDEMVAALCRNREELSRHYRIPTPEWDSVKWAWDKRNTHRFAELCGIPTPRTWCPRTLADLDTIDPEFPCVLKPAIKEHFFYETKSKAWQADNRRELFEKFDAANHIAPGEIMVQEMIPGDGFHQLGYCTFFKSGRPLGKMITRRTRQHPRTFGRASTFVETITFPEIEEMSESFLSRIQYYGLAELEFKIDPRDRKPKLLDFNARSWGYVSLGKKAGVDFPYMVYRDQLGQPVETAEGKVGVKWIRLTTDMPVGILDVLSRRTRLRPYLNSISACDSFAVFSQDDPWPGVVELALLPYLIYKRGF